MKKPEPIEEARNFMVAALLLMLGCVLLQSLVGCVSFPLPPTGDEAGKYGYIDVRVTYRPNFETIVSAMRRPNPDLATLRDK
jgi:hypothetical protein